MKNLYLLAIILCTLNGTYASAQLRTDTIYKQITDFQCDSLIKANTSADLYILDVRTPTEFSSGHLTNANNIDYRASGFWDKVDILNRNIIYLVHCKGGTRSLPVYNQMISMHFREVYMMIGGFDQWKLDGFPYVTGVVSDMKEMQALGNNIQMYLNSGDSHLSIEIKAPIDKTSLTVVNINGLEVIKQQINKNRYVLDISQLVRGVYLIKLLTGNNVAVAKFIKK